MSNKTMRTSPFTDRIYYGKAENNMWTGAKEDVTDMAVCAVFQLLMQKQQKLCPDGAYEIRMPGIPYVMSVRKESE